jgi:ribosomal protein L21E
MRKVLLGSVLFITSAAAALAQAQGPSASMLPKPIPDRASPDDVQAYSHSLTGKVAEIADGGKAVVVRLADGTRSKYLINEKTRLRADKETPLAGRKDLTLADYQPGQTVTLTLRNSDRRVLEVRLRRAKD